MADRWRGRAAGLAAGLLLAAAFGLALTAAADRSAEDRRLAVTDAHGAVLASLPLPGDGRFTLHYRNSLYRSTAEERFAVTPERQLALEQLAADELAVLDEYYGALETQRAAGGDTRQYVGRPALRVVLDELTIAATDRGRRTLDVPGHPPLELWRLVTDSDPSVTLRVEGAVP